MSLSAHTFTYTTSDPVEMAFLAIALSEIAEHKKGQLEDASNSSNVALVNPSPAPALPATPGEVVELNTKRGAGRPKGSTKAAAEAKAAAADADVKAELASATARELDDTPAEEPAPDLDDLFGSDPVPPKTVEKKVYAYEELAAASEALAKKHGVQAVKTIWKEIDPGIAKLRDLPAEKYDAYMAKVLDATAKPAAT